jgi:outer membrane protein assembly factor BamB
MIIQNKAYAVTPTGLSEETDPDKVVAIRGNAVDHAGGLYEVDEKTSTLIDKNIRTGDTIWSYTLDSSERAAGYDLANNFKANLTSDGEGNVYVSTNGGTVHSFDRNGNPRFTLKITNEVIGYSEIVPLTKNTVVITNNRHVIVWRE